MSSDSESDCSHQSDDSEYNYIPGYAILEDVEGENGNHKTHEDRNAVSDFSSAAYADEPLADEEWIRSYEIAENERVKVEIKYQQTFDGLVEVSEW
jgi:hypothetical protein